MTNQNESTAPEATAELEASAVGGLVMPYPFDSFPDKTSTWESCLKAHNEALSKQERQLEAILSFLDEGCDELLIRRIWERALRA